MVFDYTNGFHDAANAIATSVSTRALTPRIALIVAAFGNLVGSYFGKGVAETVGKDLVTLPVGRASLSVVFAGVIGAIAWNLITWYFGLPSSSTHALLGGLVGATLLAAGSKVRWAGFGEKVAIPMVVSPLVGFLLGYLMMLAVLWAFRHGHPGVLSRRFRRAQAVSATAMAFGHGMQDAAKTMGIVVLALYTGGFQDNKTHIPWWVFLTSATVLALGTYSGGWRIIRTLGRRVIHLRLKRFSRRSRRSAAASRRVRAPPRACRHGAPAGSRPAWRAGTGAPRPPRSGTPDRETVSRCARRGPRLDAARAP